VKRILLVEYIENSTEAQHRDDAELPCFDLFALS